MFEKLINAIKNNDIVQVKSVITSNPELINMAGNYGITAGHLAAFLNRIEIVRLLVESGFEINSSSKCDHVLYQIVAKHEYKYLDEILVKKKLYKIEEILKPYEGITMLYMAISKSHIELSEYLLANKANANLVINNTSYKGIGLLHIAVINKDLNTIKLLMNHNIDIEISGGKKDELHIKQTAIEMVFDNKLYVQYVEAAEYLVYNKLVSLDQKLFNRVLSVAMYVDFDSSEEEGIILYLGQGINCENLNIDQRNLKQKWIEIASFIKDSDNSLNIKLYNNIKIAIKHKDMQIIEFLIPMIQSDLISKNQLNELLYDSVANGYTDIAEIFIENGADINILSKTKDSKSLTGNDNIAYNDGTVGYQKVELLHLVAYREHIESVQLLIKYKADLDSSAIHIKDNTLNVFSPSNIPKIEKHELTALDLALEDNHPEIAKLLIEQGCEINFTHEVKIYSDDEDVVEIKSESLLSFLVGKGYFEIIKYLIEEQNLNVDELKNDGTLVQTALYSGNVNLAKLLIQCGGQAYFVNDEKKCTNLLRHAVKQGHYDVLMLLLDYGIDIVKLGIPTSVVKLDRLSIFDSSYNLNKTILHTAVRNGNPEIVKLLLNLGMDSNIQDLEKHLPPIDSFLEGIARTDYWFDDVANYKPNYLETIKLLINSKADILYKKSTVDIRTKNFNNKKFNNLSLLHVAAAQGEEEEIVQYLVSNKIDVNICNNSGLSPLHLAAAFGQLQTVNLLISLGADIQAILSDTEYPNLNALHLASMSHYFEICKLLVENGIDINSKDINEDTPLLKVVMKHVSRTDFDKQKHQLDLVKFLIDNKANVNSENKEGSIVEVAVKTGNKKLVKLLINNGASTKHINKVGEKLLSFTNDRSELYNLDSDEYYGYGLKHNNRYIEPAKILMSIINPKVIRNMLTTENKENNKIIKFALEIFVGEFIRDYFDKISYLNNCKQAEPLEMDLSVCYKFKLYQLVSKSSLMSNDKAYCYNKKNFVKADNYIKEDFFTIAGVFKKLNEDCILNVLPEDCTNNIIKFLGEDSLWQIE